MSLLKYLPIQIFVQQEQNNIKNNIKDFTKVSEPNIVFSWWLISGKNV